MITFFPTRRVAVELLGFPVHWYGLMYLIAFALTYALLPRLLTYRSLKISHEDIGTILSSSILGVIIGGRLGYVLFYGFSYYLSNPLEILFVWQGGMSSHGGFIGVAIALWLVLRKRDIPILALLDVITIPVAIGLALGRLGNFINLELYGSVTSLPWAITIPGVEGARHPTQIYAMMKDLVIAGVCFSHLQTCRNRSGQTFAIFLMLYAVLRFMIEFVRVQDHGLVSLGILTLSRGQVLTIPLFAIGACLFISLHKRR